ncbi:7975_t:CDS:1, partial [Diversispora eburnea]
VIDDKPKSPEIIEESAKNEPEISPVLPVSNESKSNNEAPPQQISYPPGYQTREQREKRLRETAIKYGENPDKFMTITEKDKDLALIFKDKMISDAEMIQFAKDTDDDPDTLMDKDIDRRARLICIEIKIRKHEDDGEFRATPYDDEEWKKSITILQENGFY